MRQVKIGPLGIRGTVDDGLVLEQVIELASAYATWIGGGPVLLARDTRPSGPMLASADTARVRSAASSPPSSCWIQCVAGWPMNSPPPDEDAEAELASVDDEPAAGGVVSSCTSAPLHASVPRLNADAINPRLLLIAVLLYAPKRPGRCGRAPGAARGSMRQHRRGCR